MTPPTVNAYYSPDRNNINFPAGILQPPFYRAGRDAAVNYGAAGARHRPRADARLRRSGPQVRRRRATCATGGPPPTARRTTSARPASPISTPATPSRATRTINGRLTLGENTADNGGLRLALMAYLAGPGAQSNDKVDGFTPEQRVFLGWAQVWCENARPEAERLKAATNPHSSNRYRVNGPLSNMPEFQKAFSCKANAPMVRPNACRVW